MQADLPRALTTDMAEESGASCDLPPTDQGDHREFIEQTPSQNSVEPEQLSHRSKAELRERAMRLRRARKKQKDIARELGVSQPTVSRLLNGSDQLVPARSEKSREFKVSATVDTVLLAIAHGGAIGARRIPQRLFDRLARCEVLQRSTVPRYYILTDATLRKLATGRQSSFIRFCLFDILHFDRLEANQFESKLGKIREIWERRRSI